MRKQIQAINEGKVGRSNLKPANSYYKIVGGGFPVAIQVGVEDNGGMRGVIVNPVHKYMYAVKGDEIHNIYGGLFYVFSKTKKRFPVVALSKGELSSFVPNKYALALDYDEIVSKFDFDYLEEIDRSEAIKASDGDYEKRFKVKAKSNS